MPPKIVTTADVSVTTLRQNLPEYLAQVERGTRVRITNRGRVIAEITPPMPAEDTAAAARKRLTGSLKRYDAPFESVIAASEWEMNEMPKAKRGAKANP
ncbi:MAG: Antitoxin [Rhodocyclales bacterium]|nr:Antitoxin [Rhodocyclales bacterium]